MNELDRRITLKVPYNGIRDVWFAWRPVRIGALGTGPKRWLTKLYRERFAGVTIYQDPHCGCAGAMIPSPLVAPVSRVRENPNAPTTFERLSFSIA
jgi:hypothetical protein